MARARATMECKLHEIIPMGEGVMVFGNIVCFHVAKKVMTDGRVDSGLLQPVGKLDGLNYATVNSVKRLNLPSDIVREVDDYGASWIKATR